MEKVPAQQVTEFEEFCQRVLPPLRRQRPDMDAYGASLRIWRWFLALGGRTEADVLVLVAMSDPQRGDLLAHLERLNLCDSDALAIVGLVHLGHTESEAIARVFVHCSHASGG